VPTWFLLGFVVFLVTMLFLRGRWLLAMWRRHKDDPGSLDEPWDPFG
jgi:hypothetical protein